MRRMEYIYPDVAFAISAVETGYWSPKARIVQNHNLFAFKIRKHHSWVSLYRYSDASGYAVYNEDWDSMFDYKVYESYVIEKYSLTNREQYIDHICKRFCPNPTYRGKLLLAFQQLKRVKALA